MGECVPFPGQDQRSRTERIAELALSLCDLTDREFDDLAAAYQDWIATRRLRLVSPTPVPLPPRRRGGA